MTSKEKEGEAAFKASYDALNAAQKQAVDTIDGPVMVIAGPGTGKTQILTLRIANILQQTDTAPESILALTFTENGARAMRERLRLYLGSRAYRVNIHTFHGLAERLIRDYPDAYSKIIGGRPATELERISILEDILASAEFKLLRPAGDPSYYLRPILSQISDLKRENVSPDGLAIIIQKQEEELTTMPKVHEKGAHKGKVRSEYQKFEKAIKKNQELLAVYRYNEASLAEAKLYDFDDMILETIKALEKNSDMLLDLQETFQYVLADEHQDVNAGQSRILELISSFHDNPNLFVVGDEKQAIFRFQGASLENFLYFEDKFPNTKTITLTDNYRSGQTILDAAHSLIKVEDGPLSSLRAPLEARAVKDSQVTLRTFTQATAENTWLLEEIKDLQKKNVPFSEVAVIVRTNREVESITSALRNEGVNANASADGDIQSHPVTKSILDLLDAVAEPHSDKSLFAMLASPYWQIDLADSFKILQLRSHSVSLASLLTSEEKLKALDLNDIGKVTNMMKVVSNAYKKKQSLPPHRLLSNLLNDSGFLKHLNENNPSENSRVVRRLYDEIESMVVSGEAVTLNDLVRKLRQMREHKLPLNAPYLRTETDAVEVMTAHKAKGLEFSYVFLPNLVDSIWGGSRNRELFQVPLTKAETSAMLDKADDEKRLLYVAMTRAKTDLYLSHSETSEDGRPLTPSRLLSLIDEVHIGLESTEKFESKLAPLEALKKPSTKKIEPEIFIDYLKNRGFSATSLNNYLESPYTWIFRNVLRLPEVQGLPLLFGTAMHAVLEKVAREYSSEKKWLSATELKSTLDYALGKLPLSDHEFASLHDKGLEALTIFLEHLKQNFPSATKQEFSVKVAMPTGLQEIPELTLTGNLDRLDFDENGRLLRVVDYKTGKPKSRNVIEGKTKDSNGNYKRQLVFYALLLDLYDDERLKAREGVISFVEPDSKGNIREEVFAITDEEIATLKAEIVTSVKEIVNGEFLKTECDPSQSDYCDLAESLFS